MPFENHAFVSYAHTDNVKAPDDDMGWVTSFTEYLNVSLTLGLGKSAQIWRDDKLQGNDEFGPEIEQQFPNTAVLVAIVSKRYLESEWCKKEVDEFCTVANQHQGLSVGNKTRVFRVLMRSIDYDQLKAFNDLQDSALVYPFYTEISVDNQGKGGRREIRLDPRYGKGEEFRLNIELLADEIVSMIETLEESAQESIADVTADNSTVYLAECAYDMRPERDRLVAELRKHGHKVLPEERLPELELEYIEAVAELLDQCQLSIHLVGSAYGSVPDGPSLKSTTILQNEVAVAKAKSSGLKRLIWSPTKAEPQSDDQQEFVTQLHRDADLQFGADLITSDIETLKSTMHAVLTTEEQPVSDEVPQHSDPMILIICDKRDRKDTIPLRKHLQHQGYQVAILVFEADSAEKMRTANEKLLRECDAVILWYGEGDEAWRATMRSDLRRARAIRGGRDLSASYTYLAGSLTDDKEEMVLMEEPNMINGLNVSEFDPALLGDFLKEFTT